LRRFTKLYQKPGLSNGKGEKRPPNSKRKKEGIMGRLWLSGNSIREGEKRGGDRDTEKEVNIEKKKDGRRIKGGG